jgi:hypothetical protein
MLWQLGGVEMRWEELFGGRVFRYCDGRFLFLHLFLTSLQEAGKVIAC